MINFYQAWKEDKEYGQALQTAQILSFIKVL